MDSLPLYHAECNDLYEVCGRWVSVKAKAPYLFEALIIEHIFADKAVCLFLSLSNKGGYILVKSI